MLADGLGEVFEALDAVVLREVGEVDRGEDVGVENEAEVRAEGLEAGEEGGAWVLEGGGDDDGGPDEGDARLIRGVCAEGDTGGDVERDGGLAGGGVPGDECEFAHRNAVMPEPVGRLRDEEFVGGEPGFKRASDGAEHGLRRKSAPDEGLFDLLRWTTGDAGEGEQPSVGVVIRAEGGHKGVGVDGAVEAVCGEWGASAIRVAAAEGPADGVEVGALLGGEKCGCHWLMIASDTVAT